MEGIIMPNFDLQKTLVAWASLEHTIGVPHNEKDYEKLVLLLDGLIDEVGEDETHPLASLMEVVGVLIEDYENRNVEELALDF
jgi:HTH-type transcriptional regulator / antitoxin HigA